ncbi:hypothetical protein [Halobaculum gomorrense]|uniref:Uncharacterized protein n=1 Tax=Halobaculum gomorrense TaxID=43928 RepID=A0A1M5MLF2_9EURY|nr:hypothetical protein [Halobaculum gomorrense]SHG78254.1 hypothetical protein SAMN05443636_1059 [Halobaculum gomorrense]
MPGVTLEVVLGWVILAQVGYILGEYTSVFNRLWGTMRLAGGGMKRAKGKPAREGVLALGSFGAGLWAGGFVWAWVGSLLGGIALGLGGGALLGLSLQQAAVVALVFVVAALAASSAAADDMEDDD